MAADQQLLRVLKEVIDAGSFGEDPSQSQVEIDLEVIAALADNDCDLHQLLEELIRRAH